MIDAFEKLKTEMQHDIELAYPDYSEGAKKLELWVDASGLGAGAYLAQEQGDSHRVIGFASMTFSQAQLHYSTIERELAALRWGVKTFRPFLYGVPFVLYTDHQPLVHLHNMKIVCSRLARTVEELADYVFEIRYVPGHLNSAADALSRLNCKVPAHNNDFEVGLPEGLVLNGYPVPGGGDSLFISILRSLPRTQCTRKLPDSALELRQLLADEILNNAARYKIKFDHESRKQIQLMRWQGQLPCLDFLLAASYLFKVKFYVYFWTPQPIIYQYDNYDPIIHLQCLSGIHFNPLIKVVDYILPSIKDCDVVRGTPKIQAPKARYGQYSIGFITQKTSKTT